MLTDALVEVATFALVVFVLPAILWWMAGVIQKWGGHNEQRAFGDRGGRSPSR
jgi:hypothetical protein